MAGIPLIQIWLTGRMTLSLYEAKTTTNRTVARKKTRKHRAKTSIWRTAVWARISPSVSFQALFPILVILAILSLYILIEQKMILPDSGPPLKGGLNEVQKSSLGLFQDLTKLFISWSIAVIGGIGYFLKSAIEGKHRLTRKSLYAGESVIACAVTSIFFGHMALNAILNMLALDIFSIRDTATVTYGILQYLFFLLSLLFFFAYVHYTFWASTQSTPEANPETKE